MSAIVTRRTISVRRAVAADAPWLLTQLRAFSDFFGTTKPLFPDDATADALLTALLAHPFYVAEKASLFHGVDPKPIGFICGTLAPHPFNPAITVLSEVFWWVDEANRLGRAGHLLLEAFLRVGREHADWIVFSLEAKSPVNPETLTKRGFHLHESSYLLEVA